MVWLYLFVVTLLIMTIYLYFFLWTNILCLGITPPFPINKRLFHIFFIITINLFSLFIYLRVEINNIIIIFIFLRVYLLFLTFLIIQFTRLIRNFTIFFQNCRKAFIVMLLINKRLFTIVAIKIDKRPFTIIEINIDIWYIIIFAIEIENLFFIKWLVTKIKRTVILLLNFFFSLFKFIYIVL